MWNVSVLRAETFVLEPLNWWKSVLLVSISYLPLAIFCSSGISPASLMNLKPHSLQNKRGVFEITVIHLGTGKLIEIVGTFLKSFCSTDCRLDTSAAKQTTGPNWGGIFFSLSFSFSFELQLLHHLQQQQQKQNQAPQAFTGIMDPTEQQIKIKKKKKNPNTLLWLADCPSTLHRSYLLSSQLPSMLKSKFPAPSLGFKKKAEKLKWGK